MNWNFRIGAALLFIFFSATNLQAEEKYYNYDKEGKTDLLGKYVDLLVDSTSQMTIENILESKQFKRSTEKVPNFGVTNKNLWLKLQFKNSTEKEKLVLEFHLPYVNILECYDYNQKGELNKLSKYNVENARDREYNHRKVSFDILAKTGTTKTVYLKIKSSERIMLPVTLDTQKNFLGELNKSTIWIGLFVGIMLAMILYHLAIYTSTQNIMYIQYSVYMLFSLLTQSSLLGIYQYHFPFMGGWFNEYSIGVFTGFVGLSGSFFAYSFLKISKYLPSSKKYFIAIYVGYVIAITTVLVGWSEVGFFILEMLGGIAATFLLIVSISTMRKGYRPARFFLIAWSVFLVGIVLYVNKDMGILPYSDITNYTMPIGVALETILLSFALADRINSLRAEKTAAQNRMLDEIRNNNILIQDQKSILEEEVGQSAKKLELASQDLSVTLENLKSTQTQLVEAEKMASLGQFTAGIAHEINNPINFVSSNVKPLKYDVEEVLSLLEKYQEIVKENDLSDTFKEAIELEEELDMEYTVDEINELLNGIQIGAKRTAEIVSSLKTFTKSGGDELEEVDITTGLQSTLTILKSKLKFIDIETHYTELPPIECYSGKLNQVFMNILDNAIYAAEKRWGQTNKGKITIRTTPLRESVKLEIEDNGIGMSKSDASKIFDPFFSTKETGKGTGLGMSISYGIIEKHNGRIKVESKEGEGSKFTIILPKKQLKNAE